MNNSQFSTQNSKLNFLEILSGFPNQKIAVIGDLILDKYLFGDVDRISPEAPVPIVKITGEKYVPGGAANVAANIATLQGQSYLFGMVGNDPNQEILKNKVAELGINIDGILIDPKKQTIRKTRVLGMNQQLLRIDYEDTNYIDPNLENEFISKLQQIENLTAIIISDYAKGTITQKLLEQIISYANQHEIALIIDPKPKHKLWYKNAFLVTPNKKEAQEMSGISIESEQDYYEAGKKLVQELSSHVIISAGAEGMYVFEKSIRDKVKGLGDREALSDQTHISQLDTQHLSILHIPTQAHEVYDVSGAGDTVVATLALAISSGASISNAANLANYAAGIKVGKSGTQPVYLEELRSMLQK